MEVETISIKDFKFEVAEEKIENNNGKVRVFVLNNLNKLIYGDHKVCNVNIYGKTVLEWVEASSGDWPCQVVNYEDGADVLETIRSYLGNEQTTIVLYDDTPLLKHATLNRIVSEFMLRGQNVRALRRGYVFNTEFIKKATSFYAPEVNQEPMEDFITINTAQDVKTVEQILKNRILTYHMQNGVRIIDPLTTYIDAEVDIAPGTIIYPNNYIFGRSVLEKDVILYPNNIVRSSHILAGSILTSAYVENAEIQEKSIIEPFTKIKY